MGLFPDTYEELLKLKGIGKYTAAAIASIAFKEPVAVVDGNVSRVLAGYLALIYRLIRLQGKPFLNDMQLTYSIPTNPDIHNQAMMEFGALVCLPRNPRCNACVLEYGFVWPGCRALSTCFR